MPTRPRKCRFNEFAKAQHHAALAGIDDVKTTRQPHDRYQYHQQGETAAKLPSAGSGRRIASAAPASEQRIQALVHAPPEFVEVRRTVVAALSPLRIIQCHCLLLSIFEG